MSVRHYLFFATHRSCQVYMKTGAVGGYMSIPNNNNKTFISEEFFFKISRVFFLYIYIYINTLLSLSLSTFTHIFSFYFVFISRYL